MYLDNELINIDHLCCLAHARAKFKYALEQGNDEDAEYFLRLIAMLYELEEEYRLRHLTSETDTTKKTRRKDSQDHTSVTAKAGQTSG